MKSVKLEYYKNLDGLRGIAAFAVIIFHFFGSHGKELTRSLDNQKFFSTYTEILQHGVTLFFVLSGFVITRILLNSKDKEDYFSRFYKRRALRIFPLYYLYLIIQNYIAPWILRGSPDTNFSNHIVQYFYLQNMKWLTGWQGSGPPHFWSLAVEEHFYLIWPLVIFLIPRKMIKPATIFFLLLAIPLKIYFYNNGIDINKNTFSRYDSIMIGCLIAILERESNFMLKAIQIKKAIVYSLIILILGAFLYVFQEKFEALKAILKHFILSSFFGIIIYQLISVKGNHLFNKILTHKFMQYLGKISYGLYVWHLAAIVIASYFGLNSTFLNFILVSVITVVISHISYYYFEKLFFRFK